MNDSICRVAKFDPQLAPKEHRELIYAFKVQVQRESEPDSKPISRCNWERSLNELSGDLVTQRWVAHSAAGDDIVGYAELTIQFNPAVKRCNSFTNGLVEVSESRRRQGIGSALLRAMMGYAASHGIGHVQLATTAHSGHMFCQSFGAENVSEYLCYSGRIADIASGMLNSWTTSYKGPPIIFEVSKEVPKKYLEEYNTLAVEVLNQRPIGKKEEGLVFTIDNIDSFFSVRCAIDAECIVSIAKNNDNDIVGVSRRTYDPNKPDVISVEFSGIKSEYRNLGLGKYINAKMLLHLKENFPLIEREQTVISKINYSNRSIREKLGYSAAEAMTLYKIGVS